MSPFEFNGVEVKSVFMNSVEVAELFMNGTSVWTSKIADDLYVYTVSRKYIKKWLKSDMSLVGSSPYIGWSDDIMGLQADELYVYLNYKTDTIKKYDKTDMSLVGTYDDVMYGASYKGFALDESYIYIRSQNKIKRIDKDTLSNKIEGGSSAGYNIGNTITDGIGGNRLFSSSSWVFYDISRTTLNLTKSFTTDCVIKSISYDEVTGIIYIGGAYVVTDTYHIYLKKINTLVTPMVELARLGMPYAFGEITDIQQDEDFVYVAGRITTAGTNNLGTVKVSKSTFAVVAETSAGFTVSSKIAVDSTHLFGTNHLGTYMRSVFKDTLLDDVTDFNSLDRWLDINAGDMWIPSI